MLAETCDGFLAKMMPTPDACVIHSSTLRSTVVEGKVQFTALVGDIHKDLLII